MDVLAATPYDPSTWTEKIKDVSSWYGPGAFYSWFLTWCSFLYDAHHDYNNFHLGKYGVLFVSSAAPVIDTVWRAHKLDFGPSWAAATYWSDKAFQFALLFYCLCTFPIKPRRRNRPAVPDEEKNESVAVTSLRQRYPIVPCVVMLAVWGSARCLANGHKTYNVAVQSVEGVDFSWQPPLDKKWKPLLAFGGFAVPVLLTVFHWELQNFGLPVGILSAFAMLHSGLFGTWTPLRLTCYSLSDLDQAGCLVATVLVLVYQYFLHKLATKFVRWDKRKRWYGV